MTTMIRKDNRRYALRWASDTFENKNRTILDRIWNFFASVKTGVTLLVLTVIAASIGTIFPQEYFIPMNVNPEQYYYEHYGSLGLLYYKLGFHNLYSSWWFLILLGLVAFSIITSSIDRGIPLHKSLKNQRTKKHSSFYKRQRLNLHSKDQVNLDELSQSFKEKDIKLNKMGIISYLKKDVYRDTVLILTILV